MSDENIDTSSHELQRKARKITIARNFNGSYFVKYILKMASAVLEDRGHYSDSESVRELLKKYL